MSEVSGSLMLKLPVAITSDIQDDANISGTEIEKWFTVLGIDLEANKFLTTGNYSHEGLEKRDDYLFLYPFDEDYMPLIRTLVTEGENIEVYGVISHEYGITEYYALTPDGNRFVGHIDEEGEEDIDPVELRKKFLGLVPQEVKKLFPEVFGR